MSEEKKSALQTLFEAYKQARHDGVGIGALLILQEADAELANLIHAIDSDLDRRKHFDVLEERDSLKSKLDALTRRLEAAEKVVKFYANHDHWMRFAESGDCNLLIAHGEHFDGTSNGWVEAAALELESKG
jgi:hypothetical protein